MAKQRRNYIPVMATLTPNALDELDAIAELSGATRTYLLRLAVTEFLKAAKRHGSEVDWVKGASGPEQVEA